MERTAHLVKLDGQILYAPVDVYDLQCVARTRKGKRCANFVESSQTAGWRQLTSKLGVITVYDVDASVWPGPPEEVLRRWRAQHCSTHDTPETEDFLAPQWEPFDPTGAHAATVKPLTDEWTP